MSDDAKDAGTRHRPTSDDAPPGDGAIGSNRSDAPDAPTATRTAAAPASTRAKSSPFHWLVDDIGLKVVALVLAFTTWILVHDQIQDRRSVDGISVVSDDLPPFIRANLANLPRITVRLSGTTAAVERARSGLEQAGHPVRLKMRTFTGDGGHAIYAEPSDFTFPFADAGVVEGITPPVRLDWYRVEPLEVEVDRPKVDLAGQTDLEVVAGQSTVEPAHVLVTGPVGVIAQLRSAGAKLAPDEVSAARWLRTVPDFATPFPWTSGFSAWRAQAPDQRAEWLLTIEPPTVGGKTRLREYKTTTAHVELSLLYPPGVDARTYEPFDVRILDTVYDARTHRLEISVRGDPALVASLAAGQSGWTLLVSLPPPPKDDATVVENFPAAVVLMPPDGPVGSTAPRLRLVSPTKVFVTLDRRKGS